MTTTNTLNKLQPGIDPYMADSVTNIRHDEIVNGDYVWTEGVLFEATNVQHHADRDGAIVVRYTGKIVDGISKYNNSLKNTGFDGGTYGAIADCPACIIKRELMQPK